jgi:hypothetical protein
MSRTHPSPDCLDLSFPASLVMGDVAEVALEDYSREIARARSAEAARDGGGISGVHLCGVAGAVSQTAAGDIEAFARSLVAPDSGGLGWS